MVGLLAPLILVIAPSVALAQSDNATDGKKWSSRAPGFGTNDWCADAMTVCWKANPETVAKDDEGAPNAFTGMRFLVEARSSYYVDFGRQGFETDLGKLEPALGLEVNLWRAWISMQALYFAPSEVTFTPSKFAKRKLLPNAPQDSSSDATVVADPKYDVFTNGSVALGLGFFDGWIAAGVQITGIPHSEFVNGRGTWEQRTEGGLYIAISPTSAIRSGMKKKKGEVKADTTPDAPEDRTPDTDTPPPTEP
ncbi:MAG: hypothetical protein JNM72_23590 [Deltaproteobacteria bacterium]|nr:hypothetical protein [Deltaproteobacteria bacterium]